MVDDDYERLIREAAMTWLNSRVSSGIVTFRHDDLAQFKFNGTAIPLMDRQRGIRKPAGMQAALSIRTRFTPPGQAPPYDDAEGPDGLLRYKYRGIDPSHPENVALRRAFQCRLPLIWFVGVSPGNYFPVYPIWLVADEEKNCQFVLAFDLAQTLVPIGISGYEIQRQYVRRLTKQRLHQPVFRAQVIHAYKQRCAICRLQYASLLDAAHILPDGHPRGTPVVPNGLSLCKIHHAAYDNNLLGVRPDLVVEVRPDVRSATDGPMLLHGLQEMDGTHLLVPTSRSAWPDPSRLNERYQEFLHAG